ncbi:putative indoleamine 2-3-dioxygenase 2-like [Scophthalmus maximus]|uniref:Putative indoleamine 2-3-dioxygenase 2-like n=1 Tax=Scophthalmus maximus TaxID=52904 RepID=A0A2U9CBC1_SCOMX|nr:putative indoleamine 2-3-dioxygenase 2-like [Scophthalmus maximus]
MYVTKADTAGNLCQCELFDVVLTNLPDYYWVWLDLANNLTQLRESRKLRNLVHKMPVLSPHLLSNHRELRLAHLALGFISMGYIWQEGKHAPAQILPKALAWPYWLAYNACVSALVDVRSYQLSIVTKYIIVPGNKAHGMGCPLSGVGTGLNTAGTGGSSLMVFLNSTHNATKKALILEKSTV